MTSGEAVNDGPRETIPKFQPLYKGLGHVGRRLIPMVLKGVVIKTHLGQMIGSKRLLLLVCCVLGRHAGALRTCV